MRAIRIVAAAGAASVLLACGTVPALASARPATDPTNLTISNKVIAKNHHLFELLTGKLTAGKKAVAGEAVSLLSRTAGHKWAATGTAKTGPGGIVIFTVTAPKRTTQFELVFAGDKTVTPHLAGSHSNVVTYVAH